MGLGFGLGVGSSVYLQPCGIRVPMRKPLVFTWVDRVREPDGDAQAEGTWVDRLRAPGWTG